MRGEAVDTSDESTFWHSCENYCTIIKAAVATLKEFNGKQPCMGHAYIIIRALHWYVIALHNVAFNMPSILWIH